MKHSQLVDNPRDACLRFVICFPARRLPDLL